MIRRRPARWPRRQYAVSQPVWTSVDCFLSCVEVFGFFQTRKYQKFHLLFSRKPMGPMHAEFFPLPPASPPRAESFALPPASPPETPQKNDRFKSSFECWKCGKYATYRCTRCTVAFYCCQTCQLEDWKQHSCICNDLQHIKRQRESGVSLLCPKRVCNM